MQQARDMQNKIGKIQKELSSTEVIGEAGAGVVKVKMDAKGTIKKITIDKSFIKINEIEVLEDLIVAALEDAKKKSSQAFADKISTIGLPPDLIKGMIYNDFA